MTPAEERPDMGMELNEAVRRIGRHWQIIALLIAAGIAVTAMLSMRSPSYTATTRLVLDIPDPRSSAESMAIADTARAIATSPSQVRAALELAHLPGRDSGDVAKKHVSVSGLGTSGVVQLSVTDPSPAVAAAIANALAQEIIDARIAVSTGRAKDILKDLNRRIATLDRGISRVGVTAAAPLIQQRAFAETERVSILAADAARPEPSIISQARVPVKADPSPLVQYVILGALLGAILGVGVAGLLETIRPTLVGGDALARAFGTNYLGKAGADDTAWRVVRIAEASGLSTVGLLPTSLALRRPDVEELGQRFEATIASVDARPASIALETQMMASRHAAMSSQSGTTSERSRARAAAQATGQRSPGERESIIVRPLSELPGLRSETGLLIVATTVLSKSDVLDAKQLIELAGCPVVGLTIHNPDAGGLGSLLRSHTRAARRERKAATQQGLRA